MENEPRDTALVSGTWQLDPARSSVEFHVRHFYGLQTVKGHFETYEGSLNLSQQPAITVVVDADSLETGNKQRDKHLRSEAFFDVTRHPQVRFEATRASLDGQTLLAQGTLTAAGTTLPLEVSATVVPVGDEFEVEATATVDHRQFGMTWSPLGTLRAPSKLLVHGRLTRTPS